MIRELSNNTCICDKDNSLTAPVKDSNFANAPLARTTSIRVNAIYSMLNASPACKAFPPAVKFVKGNVRVFADSKKRNTCCVPRVDVTLM